MVKKHDAGSDEQLFQMPIRQREKGNFFLKELRLTINLPENVSVCYVESYFSPLTLLYMICPSNYNLEDSLKRGWV